MIEETAVATNITAMRPAIRVNVMYIIPAFLLVAQPLACEIMVFTELTRPLFQGEHGRFFFGRSV